MNAWQEYKKKLGNSRPWDALNPSEYIDADLADSRYKICLGCPRLVQATKQCRECGCFMVLKTKLKGATCPLGKW